ncbi:hypothetical protein M0R04_12245 [Candidatus Dojkabacteria bacterium]|jgi:hypothetical protein|nr:hypothetical protein [Candidatus Dojkabacteria bacterium]
MRILITIHNFRECRGQQKFVYALINELVDDEFEIYTPSTGRMADISEVPVYTNPNDIANSKYDMILMFHYFPELDNVKGYRVYFCNDTNARFELFSSWKVDKFVCISEEIEEKIAKFNIKAEIIRNGIDCGRYRSRRPINKELKKVMLFNYIQPEIINMIVDYCEANSIEIDMRFITSWANETWNIPREINKSDLVISVGRGCYEAMACEREVWVIGVYGSDGIVGDNFDRLITCNCSGRLTSKGITNADEVKEILSKYNPENAKKNRERILNKFDITYVAKSIRNLHPANQCVQR